MFTQEQLIEAYEQDLLAPLPKPTEYSTHAIFKIYYDSETAESLMSDNIFKGPCHAAARGNLTDAIGLHSSCADIPITEQSIRWVNWLVNESYLSDVFLTKNPVSCIQKGFILDPLSDSEKFLAASQLCRLGASEYKESFQAILEVMKLRPELDVSLLTWAFLTFEVLLVNDGEDLTRKHARNFRSSHLPYPQIGDLFSLKLVLSSKEGFATNYKTASAQARNGWLWESNQCLLKYRKGYSTGKIIKEYIDKYEEFVSNLDSSNPDGFLKGAKKKETNYKSMWSDIYKQLRDTKQVLNNSAKNNGKIRNFNLEALEVLQKELDGVAL